MTSSYTEEQIRRCPIESDNTIVDPVTSEVIPSDRLIAIPEKDSKGNIVYQCFDIDTLYREVSAGRKKNPFTRNDLPPEALEQIEAYGKAGQVQIYVKIYDFNDTLYIDSTCSMATFLRYILDLVTIRYQQSSFVLSFDGKNIWEFDPNLSIAEQIPEPLHIQVVYQEVPEVTYRQFLKLVDIFLSKERGEPNKGMVIDFQEDGREYSISLNEIFYSGLHNIYTGKPLSIEVQRRVNQEFHRVMRQLIFSHAYLIQQFPFDRRFRMGDLFFDIAARLPGKYDSVGRYEIKLPNHQLLSDIDFLLPLYSYETIPSKSLTIEATYIIHGGGFNREETLRAQKAYDYARQSGRFGIADRIAYVYPGVQVYVEPELTGRAAEQQRQAALNNPLVEEEENYYISYLRYIANRNYEGITRVLPFLTQEEKDIGLVEAVKTGPLEMVQFLIEMGANPLSDYVDDNGDLITGVVLWNAVASPESTDRINIVSYLLRFNYDLGSLGSAMTAADQADHNEVVPLMRHAINMTNLHQAVREGTAMDVHTILDTSPDITRRDLADLINEIPNSTRPEIISLLNDRRLGKINVDAQYYDTLGQAIENGDVKTVGELLNLIDFTAIDSNQFLKRLYIRAISSGHPNLVEFLEQYGIRPLNYQEDMLQQQQLD